MRNSLSDVHPFSKIIFSFFIALISLLLIEIIGLLLMFPIFKISISEFKYAMNNPIDKNYINVVKYVQTIASIGLFIIPQCTLICICMRKRQGC